MRKDRSLVSMGMEMGMDSGCGSQSRYHFRLLVMGGTGQ